MWLTTSGWHGTCSQLDVYRLLPESYHTSVHSSFDGEDGFLHQVKLPVSSEGILRDSPLPNSVGVDGGGRVY